MEKNTNDVDMVMMQFAAIATAFEKLAERVDKEGHKDWIDDAINNKPKPFKAEDNIFPASCWKEACKRLGVKFEIPDLKERTDPSKLTTEDLKKLLNDLKEDR